MNSFIPWVGGKSQLRTQILSDFPSDPKRYIEVFGGAGWILFSRDKHAPLEVFNDLDGHLINLYRCIQYHCGELQRELKMGGDQILPNSRELFLDCLEQLNMRDLTDIQRAARYFYIIRASYGADRRTFGCSKKALHSAIDRLPDIQQRLKDVVIENRAYDSVIKTYNKDGSLFYLDPPYYNAESFYDGFTLDDHLKLKDLLTTIKGWFILSYNDHPAIRDLYQGFPIRSVDRSNCLANKHGSGRKYGEIIIKNF